MTTTSDDDATTIPNDIIADREDCPLCKKFGSGPCGETFKRWLACTDDHPGKDASGEPLHLSKCSDLAEHLAKCLDENSEYYEKNDAKEVLDSTTDKDGELKHAWKQFVDDMEGSIASGKYNMLPFPEGINPNVEVRLATRTGAAFFSPEDDGRPLVAAYILDDNGSVIAAGSKDDMDMGTLGCVLQFKLSDTTMKSASVRAVYDTENDDVAIYSQTTQLSLDK